MRRRRGSSCNKKYPNTDLDSIKTCDSVVSAYFSSHFIQVSPTGSRMRVFSLLLLLCLVQLQHREQSLVIASSLAYVISKRVTHSHVNKVWSFFSLREQSMADGFISPSRSCWAAAVPPGTAPACRGRRSTRPAWTWWGRGPARPTGAAAGSRWWGEGGSAGWCADEPPGGTQPRPRGTSRRRSRMRRMRSSRRSWRRSPEVVARGFVGDPQRFAEKGPQTWRRQQMW